MENKIDVNDSQEVKNNRRDFLKRYGKYAAVMPVALTTLMTPKVSVACSSTSGKCKDAPGQQ